jgi:hypothetical protein
MSTFIVDMRLLLSILASVIVGLLTASPAYAWDVMSVSVLAIDPQTPTTVYAATCDGTGVLKSTDGGVTWSAPGPAKISISVLIVDPWTPTTLYAAVGEWICASPDGATSVPGVYKSTDSGASWNITGLAGIHVNALVIDPTTPTTLYAAAEWAGVLKSTDGGDSWARTVSGPFMTQSLAIDPLTPTTIYAADSFVGDEGFTCHTNHDSFTIQRRSDRCAWGSTFDCDCDPGQAGTAGGRHSRFDEQ